MHRVDLFRDRSSSKCHTWNLTILRYTKRNGGVMHSFIDFRNSRFLVNDIDIWVFCGLINQAARSSSMQAPEGVSELFDWWRESIETSGGGCIDLRLDEFLVDTNRVEYMCWLSNLALSTLSRIGPKISAEQLNDIVETPGCFRGERRSKDFEIIVKQFRSLLGCSTGV